MLKGGNVDRTFPMLRIPTSATFRARSDQVGVQLGGRHFVEVMTPAVGREDRGFCGAAAGDKGSTQSCLGGGIFDALKQATVSAFGV